MLRWRLLSASVIVAVVALLCWLDLRAAHPGTYLLPLAVLGSLLTAREVLAFYAAREHRPLPWVVYAGTLLTVLACSVPMFWPAYAQEGPIGNLGWLTLGFTAGVLVALAAEVGRYEQGTSVATKLALSILAIMHAGGLMGFLVQLRLLDRVALPGGMADANPGGPDHCGMLALLSVIAVVKLSDTGAYFTGRRFGRRKLAPALSPGKTWEGLGGGLAAAVLGAMLMLGPVATWLGCGSERSAAAWLAGCVAYAVLLTLAGLLGDLTASLLKRDAGVKDSSRTLPGLGGVLDVLDSLLVAAPVGYACWVMGLVG